MIRTQIYIPEILHSQAQLVAKQQNKPMAEILREFIRQGVKNQQGVKTRSLKSLIQLRITGGPEDLSQNMDKYLYQK